MKKKKQGFEGERILELTANHQMLIDHKELLSFSKIGFFPKAKHQYEESTSGHHYHILVYCIKGYGKAEVNNITYDIRVGEFFFIPKDTAYKYFADNNNPWTIYWFNFEGNTAMSFLDLYYFNTQSYKGYLIYNEERIHLFDMVYKNLKRGYSKNILLLLNTSLFHFLTSFIFNIKSKANQKNKNQEIVNAAIEYMKKNIDKSVTLQDIAQHVNVSVSHFSYLFKSKTGIPPVDYYNQMKMQKACQLLEYTDVLVKEIAFKLGIEDNQYFSRLFSKVIGMSPNTYRNTFSKAEKV